MKRPIDKLKQIFSLNSLLLVPMATFHAADASAQSRSESKTAERKPNVIIIMTDDQGYGDLA